MGRNQPLGKKIPNFENVSKVEEKFSATRTGGCGGVCLGGRRVQSSYGKCLQLISFFLDCFLLVKCPTVSGTENKSNFFLVKRWLIVD